MLNGSSQFGTIRKINPSDLPSKPTSRNFDMDKISRISQKIAKIEHEKRTDSEGSK